MYYYQVIKHIDFLYPILRRSTLLPSEYRYSASLIIGVGIVHVLLGILNLSFSLLAVIFEPSANFYASGIWTSPFTLLCGLCGILASTRWYISYQILIFLLTSILSTAASGLCLVMTALGIHCCYYQQPQTTLNENSLMVTVNIMVATSLGSTTFYGHSEF